jgi:hypothetical protein
MAKGVSEGKKSAPELPPYSGPPLEKLRKNLSALVTGGLVQDNVAEQGDDLLTLQIVKSRLNLADGAGEDDRDEAHTEALTAVLKDAVQEGKVLFKKHRRLLRYVLPLEADFLGKSIEERRTEAGKKMISNKEVKPGTIRTYYEPRALDELARVLVEMEAEHCGEAPLESDH